MKIYTYEGKANISGDRIHQARTAQRLSQDALAAKLQVAGLGIGREAISRIETGLRFVTDYELVIFARVLGVTIVCGESSLRRGLKNHGSHAHTEASCLREIVQLPRDPASFHP